MIINKENSFLISDVIKDSYFIKFVDENIDKLRDERLKRPSPKPGFYYKRDWYDRMVEERMLNTKFFINNITVIWMKKSSLPSVLREPIKYVCDIAYQQMLIKYTEEINALEVILEGYDSEQGKILI